MKPKPKFLGLLQLRLAEAEETLRAIRTGEADAVVTAGKDGLQIYTLEGAEHAYRVLIESMNEGALTLATDKTILYANQCFARLVKCPLEQVIGGSFRRYLAPADQARLRPLMKQAGQNGAKLQVQLKVGHGASIPVQISLRRIARRNSKNAIIGMVVSDVTEARRMEELLRSLTQRVVRVQEAERETIALTLHDDITQLLCAVRFSVQALVTSLTAAPGPVRKNAMKLQALLVATAAEVERLSRELRPSALRHLGLGAVLRETGREFARRTGVPVALVGRTFSARLPDDTELALYRILQEALRNVEKHAHARHVTVSLRPRGPAIALVVTDDGVGFVLDHRRRGRRGTSRLGLLGMRERVAHVGGTLTIKSGRCTGTEVEALIPLPPPACAA